MKLEEMYREIILDHYRHPHNYGELANADIKVKDSNPLCGDVITMQMNVNGGTIKDVKFVGRGCAISQASASLLTDFVKGKKIDEIKKLDKNDVLNLLGIEISYVRLKCALLSLKVLKSGLYSYLGEKLDEDFTFNNETPKDKNKW